MVVRSRTISRIADVTPIPAWRRAMASTDTLYNVSTGAPSQANPLLIFPGGVIPYGFTTNEDYGWDVMSGYSSGVLLEEVGGLYGTLVFGTGGHTRIQNQILSLPISDDAPSFGWFQQPYFETREVNGAELYYNRAEFNALPARRRTGDGGGTETTMTLTWLDAGGFAQGSMGYEGWIFPRKIVTGQLGNSNPHGFRYMAPCYVPMAMTGTGEGAYVVVPAPQGPFSQSWRPDGTTDADIADASVLWPSGRRKRPVWCKSVVTGAWTRVAPNSFLPDFVPYGFIAQHTAVARDQARVYVSVDVGGGTAAWWFVDLSAGLAGARISGLTMPPVAVAPNRGTTGAFTNGHPAGRHLWYWPDLLNRSGLVVQDLDDTNQARLAIGQGLDIAAGEEPAMQYVAAANRIIVLQRYGSGVLRYRTISIPSNPLDAAGYVVSPQQTLAIYGSVRQPIAPSYFYSKAIWHPGLGVMFVPQDRGPMLAFRPGML